ncbi:Rhs-family protein [Sandaracinus amylolyticus]|uniref:Rhs-family protein n=1 Tax=Sandaracinus amylolyticus TaxID=927083 RepID=A0A0F6W6Q3_9BACT|nr:Rhs-family protein [Sandaracinus amylolyticus]
MAGSKPGLVGDPIDVVTGAVLDRVADFRVVDEPVPFVWRRSYDSARSDTDRGFGWGHAHELDHALEWDLDGVLYRRPHDPAVAFPHAFADGIVGVAGGLELERIDTRHFVVRGHAEPERHFERGPSASFARLVRIDQAGASVRLEHDGLGQLASIVLPSGRRLRVDWERGHLVQVVLLDAARGGKALTRYRYDEHGCLVEGRDAYQQTFRLAYDSSRRVERTVDRRGYTFSFEYDRDGRCVRSSGEDGVLEVRLEHRTHERATVVREASGGEWLYQYDPSGALLQVVDPFGGVRFWERDGAGRIVREVDPTGATTQFEYDARGAMIARVEPSGRRIPLPEADDALPPDAHRVPGCALQWELGDLEQLAFDAATSFPETTWLASERSLLRTPANELALASVRERRDEQGLLLAQQRDGASRTWGYDPSGNVRRYTDFDGRTYTSEHASWNHRVLERDPLGRTTRFTYTKAEKLASLLDGGGTLSEYRYDAKERLVEVRRAGTTRDQYEYDLADRLIAKRDAFGRILLELSYAPTGLLAERKLATGDVQRFEHDGRGRYRVAENDAGRVTFDYDAWGHRIADRRDGLGVEHRYVGDRLVHTRTLGRFDIRYERGAESSVRIIDPTGAAHTLRRLAPGVFRRELADGASELVQYAPDGRCLAKAVSTSSGDTWSREYAYGGEGDLVANRDSARGTIHYEHDVAHQVASVRHESDEEPSRYVYDGAGNLLEKPGLRGVTLIEGNRLYAANGDAFEYDHRHHLAARRGPDGSETRFHHDARDQLVRIDLPDGSTWRAHYDALGRRTKKRHDTRESTYWWDTDRLAAERLPDGRVRIYVYADDFAMVPVLFVEYEDIESAPESGRRYYVFADHQGTPELIRDQQGEAVWWARREPYGVVVEGGHEFHQPFRFPGHFWDAETRLHYNRFRYYSPELGRYLQSDPWGVAGGTNTHAYTENPLRQVDVRGLMCEAARRPVEPSDTDVESPTPRYQQGSPEGTTPPRIVQGDLADRLAVYDQRHGEAARQSDSIRHAAMLPGFDREIFDLAASDGASPDQVAARQLLVEDFIGSDRWDQGEKNGFDFTHPVFVGPPPEQAPVQGQWQAHSGEGSYFADADVGTTPHDVGVHEQGFNRSTGRMEPKTFNVREMTNGDEPYIQGRAAACYDEWSEKPPSGPARRHWTYGGGVQRTYRNNPDGSKPTRSTLLARTPFEHND